MQDWASECPDVKNYKWRLNPVWHRMLYSCTHMATVRFKGLKMLSYYFIMNLLSRMLSDAFIALLPVCLQSLNCAVPRDEKPNCTSAPNWRSLLRTSWRMVLSAACPSTMITRVSSFTPVSYYTSLLYCYVTASECHVAMKWRGCKLVLLNRNCSLH